MRAYLSLFCRALAALVTAGLATMLSASPATAAPCSVNCLTPGDYTITTFQGLVPRNYLVHVPASYTGGSAVPMLVDFHGFSKDMYNERQYSGQLGESDKRGFIAVWPNGIALSWNAYGCCFVADALHLDDTAFVRQVVAGVKARANIDDTRVFVTGISNGGGMAQRMACEAADIFRASVSVSYPLNTANCHPSRPISLTEIAGTADTVIGYAGGTAPLGLPNDTLGVPLGVQGARESFAAWKVIDGCDATLNAVAIPGGTTWDGSRWEEYTNCAAGVRVGLVTIANGKHVLYNGYVDQLGGYPDGVNAPIDVAPWIWDHVFNL